ncbi:hypothetical protein GC163_06195 [bacterium]|nr:hypothetical protein [bacterium]
MMLSRFQTLPIWLGLLFITLSAISPVELVAQAPLDKRLIQKTSLSGESQPLDQLLETLCTKHKLKLQIDSASLAKLGIDPAIPISGIQAEEITLASALNLILEPFRLSYVVDKGTLYVAPEAKLNEQLVTRTYPLGGLGVFEPIMLQVVLERMCSGEWEQIDGVGGTVLAISPQNITISQSPSMQAEIADLLERITAALAGKRRTPTLVERSEDLLRRTLARPTELAAGELTIKQLCDLLRTELKMNVVLSETDLADEGLDLSTKISLSGKKEAAGITVATALAQKDLVPLIRNEVLYITTKVKASEYLMVQIYDARTRNLDAEEIAVQVVQIKELGPWEDVEGIGGAVAVFGPLVLIRQTAAAHEKLAQQLGPGK